MKSKNRCAHCRCNYKPNPRIKNQNYCGKPACQRARKAEWQRRKMENDLDYRLNQQESQKSWQERHPDYWKEYRRNHPKYTEQNRRLQQDRDRKRRVIRLAKKDALISKNTSIPGSYYYIIPVDSGLAKMDASIEKIYLIPESYLNNASSCKKGRNRLDQRTVVI